MTEAVGAGSSPPSGSRPLVAVALPAFNEDDGIGEFLHELDSSFEAAGIAASFVVVDDGSTDRTCEVLQQVGLKLRAPLAVSRSDVNRGHGPTTLDAYRLALKEQPEIIVQVDGDGQFNADDVVRIATSAAGDGKPSVAVRMGRSELWYRTLLTECLRIYLRTIFSVSSPDPNSPLRAYPTVILKELVANVPEAASIPNVYLTILAHRTGHIPRYIPVPHRVRRGLDPRGSSWREGSVIPKRLIRLVFRSAGESVRFRQGKGLKDRGMPG